MVDYGKRNPDEEPTSTHVHRAERKYRGHKLAQAINHIDYERHHGGESTKPHGKKVERGSNKGQ